MPVNDQNEQRHGHPDVDPENPVSQHDAPGGLADQEAIQRASQDGINPIHVDSMSRAEDDARVRASSPDFSDHPPTTKLPRRASKSDTSGD